jgi:hypothetical protein
VFTFPYSRLVLGYRSDGEFCYTGVRGSIDPVEDSDKKERRMGIVAHRMRSLLDGVNHHADKESTLDEFGDVVNKLTPGYIPEWISRDHTKWIEILPEDKHFGPLMIKSAF